jgi:multidrug efflux pump subunit AcrA (membrane-fusion protein)
VKWVVEESTLVKKGERLAELDDSALRERLGAQAIALEQARTARLAAQVDLKITRKENELAIRSGELSLKLAKRNLKKYAGNDPEFRMDESCRVSFSWPRARSTAPGPTTISER